MRRWKIGDVRPRNGRQSRLRLAPKRVGALLGTLAAILSVGAEPSFAGTYVMRSCDVPGQPFAPMGPWRPTSSASVALLDGCAEGAGYRYYLPGVRTMDNPSIASLDLVLPVDDGQAIAFVSARAWVNARLAGSGVPLRAGLQVIRGTLRYDLAGFPDGLNAADPVSAQPIPEPAPALRLALICEETDRPGRAAGANPCNVNEATPLEVLGVEVTLREDVPPTASVSGGTILSDRPLSGFRSLDYVASDSHSGLARVEVVIGETVVAAKDLTTRCAHADFVACPPADRDSLAVDTNGVPDGRYPLKLRAIDAAGNRSEMQVQVVDVRNRNAPPDARLPTATLLIAGFGTSSRSSLIVPFGRPAAIRGRLSGLGDVGLADAQVNVFERTARAGAKEKAVGSVQTRSDGTFTYQLAKGRPSRVVRLAYGGLGSKGLALKVRAAATLDASLRATTIRFRGRVMSLPLPRGGKRVVLQGKAPGFAWASFARPRTDARGNFSGRYHLPIRRPGVKLQIRVRVPTERGYPYLNYTGRPVTLRVR